MIKVKKFKTQMKVSNGNKPTTRIRQ